MKKIFLSLSIILLVIIFDQWSKIHILKTFFNKDYAHIIVTDFFNLVLTWNKGVSFGMFNKASYSNHIFTLLSAVIILVLFSIIKKADNKLAIIGYSMIIGGAIGNLIDRFKYGAVVDFLDFHIMGYHWPAFNIADSAICVGVFIAILETILYNKKSN